MGSDHEGQVHILSSISDVCASGECRVEPVEGVIAGPLQTAEGDVALFGIHLHRPAAGGTIRLDRVQEATVEHHQVVLDGRPCVEGEGRAEVLPTVLSTGCVGVQTSEVAIGTELMVRSHPVAAARDAVGVVLDGAHDMSQSRQFSEVLLGDLLSLLVLLLGLLGLAFRGTLLGWLSFLLLSLALHVD
jgi:hypothetical protein